MISIMIRLVVENVHGAMAAPVLLTVEHPLSMATVSIFIIILFNFSITRAAIAPCTFSTTNLGQNWNDQKIKGTGMETLVEIIFRLHVSKQHLRFDQNVNKLGFADADH